MVNPLATELLFSKHQMDHLCDDLEQERLKKAMEENTNEKMCLAVDLERT